MTDTIRDLMRRGVIVRTVINGLVFDGATKDPMQQAVRDALINFMAATAQAQAEATKEAQRAGIAHAKAREDAYRGRKPSYARAHLDAVRAGLAQGASVSAIARDTGLSRQTVYRIEADPAEAEAALARWGGRDEGRQRQGFAARSTYGIVRTGIGMPFVNRPRSSPGTPTGPSKLNRY